jgi:hypothetical protein
MIYVNQIFIEFIIIFYYKLCRLDVHLYWPGAHSLRTLLDYCHWHLHEILQIYIVYSPFNHSSTRLIFLWVTKEGENKKPVWYNEPSVKVSAGTLRPVLKMGGGGHNAQLNFDVSHCTTHNRSLSCSPQELKLRACAVFALKADLDSCALLARDNLFTYMSHSSKNTV